MTPERLEEIRTWVRGFGGFEADELLAEVDRLRAQVAEAWDEGAQAATDWIGAGAWVAIMPTNPHRGDDD